MGRIIRSLALMVLVGLAVLGKWQVKMVSGDLTAAQCKEERRVGVNACKPVLNGKLPSPACCQLVRVSHVKCICSVITPKLAALIDVKQAILLIEGCGRRVPRHYKCGSITTP